MLAIILLFPGLVGEVPMTVLAALMIVSGFGAIDFREALSIWNTAGAARWAIIITFVATLALSVPVAVATGVVFTISCSWHPRPAILRCAGWNCGKVTALPNWIPPKTLESDTVTVLNIYGSLFFAGARTLGDALPDPGDATRPVVVLRMRGRTQIGATLIDVLDEYADDLAERGGRLYIAGVDEDIADALRRAHKLDIGGSVHLYPDDEVVLESTGAAVRAAREWLGRGKEKPHPAMIP